MCTLSSGTTIEDKPFRHLYPYPILAIPVWYLLLMPQHTTETPRYDGMYN